MEQILLQVLVRHVEDREVIRDSQHGFTKGKSCLTNSVAFYDPSDQRTTEELRMSSIWTSLRPLTQFPMTSFSLHWRDGFDGCTVQYMRNRLDGRIQRVVVKGHFDPDGDQ